MTIPKVPNSSQHIVSFPAGAEGAGAKKSRLEEPAAVILAGDVLRWVIPKVGKFPKNVRYGFGARGSKARISMSWKNSSARSTRAAATVGGRSDSTTDGASPAASNALRMNLKRNQVLITLESAEHLVEQ